MTEETNLNPVANDTGHTPVVKKKNFENKEKEKKNKKIKGKAMSLISRESRRKNR